LWRNILTISEENHCYSPGCSIAKSKKIFRSLLIQQLACLSLIGLMNFKQTFNEFGYFVGPKAPQKQLIVLSPLELS
jgi:hypothetical protein